MKRIHFEVLPDVDGGWNVTRDRVVTAGFDQKDRAERYAASCCRKAKASGTPAELVIMARDGSLQRQANYEPRPQPD